ncbi:hypothetical protein Tco_1456266 [Tanacetum coccineum]
MSSTAESGKSEIFQNFAFQIQAQAGSRPIDVRDEETKRLGNNGGVKNWNFSRLAPTDYRMPKPSSSTAKYKQ